MYKRSSDNGCCFEIESVDIYDIIVDIYDIIILVSSLIIAYLIWYFDRARDLTKRSCTPFKIEDYKFNNYTYKLVGNR